jgi:hypothetical protein
MTRETTLERALMSRERALAALINAVEVYKAFRTLEPTGLVHSGDGLDDAMCAAAVALANASRAVVMEHRGMGVNPDTGRECPSLKALPSESYEFCAALTKTK